MKVTRLDHIELIVQHFDEFVQLFRAMGFQECVRTTHHGDSIELQEVPEVLDAIQVHARPSDEIERALLADASRLTVRDR